VLRMLGKILFVYRFTDIGELTIHGLWVRSTGNMTL